MEALVVHFRSTGQVDVLEQLQETWMLFRSRCELVIRKEELVRPVPAWYSSSLEVFAEKTNIYIYII